MLSSFDNGILATLDQALSINSQEYLTCDFSDGIVLFISFSCPSDGLAKSVKISSELTVLNLEGYPIIEAQA